MLGGGDVEMVERGGSVREMEEVSVEVEEEEEVTGGGVDVMVQTEEVDGEEEEEEDVESVDEMVRVMRREIVLMERELTGGMRVGVHE